MTHKKIAQNTGNSGRVNISGAELTQLGATVGDDLDVNIADTSDVTHALIDSKDTGQFLIITPK